MIDLSFIDAVEDECSRKPTTCYDFESLFINSIRHEVLSKRAIVRISYFVFHSCVLRLTTLVIEVFNVDKVYVSVLRGVILRTWY